MQIFYVIFFASKTFMKMISLNSVFDRIRALQFPLYGWLRMHVNHGSVTHVAILRDGIVVAKYVGDVGFMPSNKVTG